MSIENIMKETREIIDEELKNVLKHKSIYQDIIFESIDYSLFTGGKRLRPIFLLKTCEMFKNNYENAIPFALAIEMIHTYSLIHDDLPAMDDDDFRRGKLTNHKVYGEAMAILAGDGLLNLAFETMLEYTLNNSITIDDYKRNTRAMSEIVKYSGIYGMIGGQTLDLISNEISMDEDKLLSMYENKTAALIQASLVSGAILGGANDVEIENMREFGLNLGLAYQIKDDILEEKEDREINKLTYATYNGVEVAEKEVEKLSKRAIELLSEHKDRDINFLKELTSKLIYRLY
ncbi:MAG: polyprenyl synthetase family protein [Tissierellia bacterium]|nr:polyprenyl synthetase family protein [Tissierellia bacterium]